MAEDKPTTPEQQLLKLIESSGKPAKTGAAPAGIPAKPKAALGFSLANVSGAILGRLAFLKRHGKKMASSRKTPLSIADVNKALYVAVAGLFIYVVFDAAASAMNLKRPPNFAPPKDMKVATPKVTAEPLKGSSFYLQKMSTRDIFKEGKKVVEVRQEKEADDPGPEASAVIQNLSLVGISWSSNPDAIIEDKQSKRTFFVKRGQAAGDSVKVEAIFKDHVVVSYEDKEYELR